MNKIITSLTLCTLLLSGCSRERAEDFNRISRGAVEYTSVTERVTSEERTATGIIYEVTEERKRMLEIQVPVVTGPIPGYFYKQLELPNRTPKLMKRTVIWVNGYGKMAGGYYINIAH